MKLTNTRFGPFAALAAALTFVLGMVGCAAAGWHAPNEIVIAAVYIFGLLEGLFLAYWRGVRLSAELDGEASVVHVRSAGNATLAGAFLAGAATAAGGAVAVIALIDELHGVDLVVDSLLGSLWMATYPLHPLLAHRLFDRRVSIGVDALRCGRALLPFRDVRSATARGRELVVERRSARALTLVLSSAEAATALADRIAASATPSSAVARGIGRAGRSLDTWKRELLSPDYRSHAISSDEASLILGAGTAAPDERVGAALVLQKAGEQARIRVAAAACLDPHLRIALERVADDQLDEAVLRPLETDRAAAATARRA